MKPYIRGSYNKCDEKEQWIRLTEGCPNDCEYCRETKECGKEPIYLDIPEITRNKVKVMDMNLMYKPNSIAILDKLGNIKVNDKVVYYELICGIDWRYINEEKANALKRNRFRNVRFAWDYHLDHQYKIKDCIKLLNKAGFNNKNLMCFILSDWKVSFFECFLKLQLLKNWNIKVSPCYFDNSMPPNFQCNYWTYEECRIFQDLCSLHNQTIMFGIYPDLKRAKRVMKRFNELILNNSLTQKLNK